MQRPVLTALFALALACDSKETAKTDAPAKVAKADTPAKVAKADAPAKADVPAKADAPADAKADAPAADDGYVPEKTPGPAPKIVSSWVEVDQGGINTEHTPAISTDGKTVVHDNAMLGGGAQIMLRDRKGALLETIDLLTPKELETIDSVDALGKILDPRIEAAQAKLAARGWVELVGGMITPDERKKSGLEAVVEGDRLIVTRDGAEAFAGDVAKREPCEKPYVHGLWRDPDGKLAYVLLGHSLDDCKPQRDDEHVIVPLK